MKKCTLEKKGGNMPPSGFDKSHTQGIRTFLENCVKDLINENKGLRTPKEALDRELQHIATDRATNKRLPASAAALTMVEDFYQRTRSALLSTQTETTDTFDDLQDSANLIIYQICADIESIKVLET